MRIYFWLLAVMILAGCAGKPKVAGSNDAKWVNEAAKAAPCKEGDVGGMSSTNGGPWEVEVCHGGKYVYDEPASKKYQLEAVKAEAEAHAKQVLENEHKRKLYWALRTRVLTDKEMDEVQTYGSSLVIEWENIVYWSGQTRPDDSEKRAIIFNDALLQQMKLRKLAAEPKIKFDIGGEHCNGNICQ